MSTDVDAASTGTDCRQAILRKVKESADTSNSFFEENCQSLELLADRMAKAFSLGGKLFVMGNGGSACDAEHISVEFMHPIFEKRKPLPCVNLSSATALITAVSNDMDFSRIFSEQLRQLASAGDMVLAISTSGMSANLVGALKEAKSNGLMTLAFLGKDGGRIASITDWSLIVPSFSIHRIQETHVLLLHILWDLIHIKMGEEDIV